MCDGNRPRASGRTRSEQHPKQRSSMGSSVPNHWQDGGNHAERFGERSGAADIPGKQPAAQRFNLCFERNPQRESLSGARHKTALQGIGSWRIASEQNRDIPQLVGDARSCGKEWRTLPCGSRHREQVEGWRASAWRNAGERHWKDEAKTLQAKGHRPRPAENQRNLQETLLRGKGGTHGTDY